MDSYLKESSFRDKVVALLIRDRKFLIHCSPLLDKKDFDIGSHASKEDKLKAIIASIGLEFFEKYRDPLGSYLKTEIRSYAKTNKLSDSWRTDALDIATDLFKKKITASEYVVDKLIEFKKAQAKKSAISKLIDLQETGDLTDEEWVSITQAATLPALQDKFKPVDYFKRLEKRIQRRKLKTEDRFPVLFIEPLDRLVRVIARGHLGLILAPYKRGKSLLLMHIALALVLQKYNVLYVTLEDPIEDLEDRLDAAVTFLPIRRLNDLPKKVRARFDKFKRNIKRRLKLVDGTEGGMTVDRLQTILDQQRNEGFFADAVIVDYDEELQAKSKNKERRMDFDEIYRDLRRFMARNQLLGWTAAQSKRGTSANKIVSADDAAEDISKVKKASCVLSVGQGDWGPDSLYIYVAAHKHDKHHVGVNIMSDLDRMRIYDRDKTRKAIAAHPEMKRREK